MNLLLQCGVALILNYSGEAYTPHDFQFFKKIQNENKCAMLYPESPCLAEIRKTGFQSYFLLCGSAK